LIDLVDQFGFSERLVRTSMFRLGTEGWFEVERVGRRSRYRLTPWAMGEFAAAETRIYGVSSAWDGLWTLVLVDAASGPAAFTRAGAEAARAVLAERGFAPVAPGVLAAPRADPDAVAGWLRGAGAIGTVPIARARFHDVAGLAGTGWPASAFDLEPVAQRYGSVVGTYGPLAAAAAGDPGGLDMGDESAFALRTMLVHELRRARLGDPELPLEALPAAWPGPGAVATASAVYHAVAEPAERWLAKVTGLVVDPAVTACRLGG
ncbi:MAG: phenylacetic acid degradation operon negative regulatory protein PaaX, partial [Acidimicrobiia bacterium]|nr:phenylacetic acid degradation operon negative regulatory protein PaaX [Acidimicrobiia bacterium]